MSTKNQYAGLKKVQFFGYWRWLHARICPHCQKTVNVLGGDTRRAPSLPPGAITCPHCNFGLIDLG